MSHNNYNNHHQSSSCYRTQDESNGYDSTNPYYRRLGDGCFGNDSDNDYNDTIIRSEQLLSLESPLTPRISNQRKCYLKPKAKTPQPPLMTMPTIDDCNMIDVAVEENNITFANEYNGKKNDDYDDSDSDDSESIMCPLFMDSLPRDFSSNIGLAAIASLLDEQTPQQDEEESTNSNPLSDNENNAEYDDSAKEEEGECKKPPTSDNNNCIRTTETSARQVGVIVCGGGKVVRRCMNRHQRRTETKPYFRKFPNKVEPTTADNIHHKKTKTSTIGEAQLFLKMWKL